MPSNRALSRLTVIAIVVMAVGLSACGRRGALEPPPSAAATSGGYAATAPGTDTSKSDKPFFLDFLL